MRTLLIGLGSCLLAALPASGADAAKARDPFRRTEQAAPVAADPSAPFEFTGMFTTGSRTMVALTSKNDKRSRWIAVGAQADGIRVASFDEAAQSVVVEHQGKSYALPLKRSTARPAVAGALPAGGPLPVAQAADPVPLTDAEKEREARFLVSDLMEIGMIQRKAYEEAQRKAANGQATEQPNANTNAPKPQPQQR